MRPTSLIWEHVTSTTSAEDQGKKVAICRYCKITYRFPNATRMTTHIVQRCPSCPYDVRNAFKHGKDIENEDESACDTDVETADLDVAGRSSQICSPGAGDESTSSKMSFASTPSLPAKSPKTPKKNMMSSFLDKMAPLDKEKIDEAIARAVYASGVPLSIFNNGYWDEAFRLIRPTYKKPSIYSLSTPLLEAEFARVQHLTRDKIDNALCLGLMTDGWTNICGEGIVNFIISTPAPVFLKSLEPGVVKETAAYIATEIINVITEIGATKFLAVVTDNASAMKAAWRIVSEKFPHIACIGCAAHGLNLLLNDIMALKSIEILYKKVKGLVKYFKNSHVLLATFKAKQEESYGRRARTLKLPSKTRWGAIVISFESVLGNKVALQQSVIIDELKVDKAIRRNVLDDVFWTQLQHSLTILEPVTIAISKSEADDAILSDVPTLLAGIEQKVNSNLATSPITKQEEKQVQTFLAKRKAFIMKPIHSAANLVDPRYKGSTLNDDEIVAAFDYIIMLAKHLKLNEGKVLGNLAEYRTSTSFWARDAVWATAQSTSPLIWWQGLCTGQHLSPIASRLLSIPPSSAASERNWSVFGAIHTKSHNRLAPSRVQKLVAIKSHLMGAAALAKVKVSIEREGDEKIIDEVSEDESSGSVSEDDAVSLGASDNGDNGGD